MSPYESQRLPGFPRSGLSPGLLAEIERGTRDRLDGRDLLKLADGLRLGREDFASLVRANRPRPAFKAYVVGLADPDRGQIVAAAVVPELGRQVDTEGLRAYLRGELSAYKVPRHWFVMVHEELPFTDTGKIDKRRLTAMLEQRRSDASES